MKISKLTINKHTILFVVLLYCYTFRNILVLFIPFFGYVDEILAIAGLSCFFIEVFSVHKLLKRNILIAAGIVLFVTAGILGNIIFMYQPLLSIAIPDLLLSIKFFLWIYFAIYFCKKSGINYNILFSTLSEHAKILLCFLFFLTVIDGIFHIFNEYSDVKMGIRAVALYEGATSLASTATSLMCLCLIGEGKLKWTKEIIFGLFVILATLRFKSLAAVAVFIVFFYFGKALRKKIKWWYFIVLGLLAVFVARKQILAVVQPGIARSMLFIVGFRLLVDYFPLGTGFGTYASYFSKVRYSPIYKMYHLSNVYGLSVDRSSFINDTFWPMVLGQTGFIGTVGYFMVLLWIYLRIQNCISKNIAVYYGGMYILLYLLLTSFGESAFLHWNSMLFAILFGIIISYSYNGKTEKGYETGKKEKCS